MNQITVRMLDRERDGAAAVEVGDTTWGSSRKLSVEQSVARKPWRAMSGAFDGETLIGIWGAYALQIAVPGPLDTVTLVPTEGATTAAVHPDHTRKGAITALIRAHLERCRNVGAAITVHGASEPGIYGRFGYAPAQWGSGAVLSGTPDLILPEDVAALADATSTHSMLGAPEHARRLVAIQRRCARHLGALVAEPWQAGRDMTSLAETRGDAHPDELIIATRDGVDVGAAVVSRTVSWNEQDLPAGKVRVRYLDGVDAGAIAALIRRVCRYDLIRTVTISRWGLGSPLAAMLPDGPRTYGRPGRCDDLWLRLVDLPGALTQRGYAVSCDVVMDMTDTFLPENAGRWRLTVDATGYAACARTTDSADVRLDIAHLGAAYLGQRPLLALADNGTITEHRDGALRDLSHALRSQQSAYGGFGF